MSEPTDYAPAVIEAAPLPATRPIPQGLAIMLPPDVRPDEVWALKQTYPGAPDQKIAEVIITAKAMGINPLRTRIYLVSRETRSGTVWTLQASIDAFRAVAGEDVITCHRPTEFAYDSNDALAAATVWGKTFKHGQWHEVCATALFSEYAQRDRDGQLTGMWQKMPHNQLAKCAEALLLRRAAPAKLAGVYSSDEMAQAGNIVDVQVSAPRPEPARVIEAPRAVAPADAPKADPAPVPPAAEEQTRPEFVKKMESDHVKTASGVVEVFRIICESGAVYQTTSTGLAAMARTMMVKAERAAVTFIETPRGLGLKGIAAAPVAAGSMAAAESALLARAKAVMVQGEFDSWSEILQTPAAGDWEKFEAEIIKAEESAAKLEA